MMHADRFELRRSIRGAKLTAEVLESRDLPSTTYDLGVAADFNAFIFNNMNVYTSDIEGRVAVGGDASFYAYGIGDKLTNSNGLRDDLIVGNDLNYTYGQVFNGNIVYGDNGNLTGVGTPNGTVRQQANVLDFASAETALTTMSSVLGAEAPNGFTHLSHSTLNLRGTNATLDFFTVTADQLANAKSVLVIVPRGATVVINVPDDAVSIQNLGLRFRGVSCDELLWNFPQATNLTISGVGLMGSILAPNADLSFNNGQIQGTVIAASMTGNGELHPCTSQVQVVIPDPASIQGLVFVDVDGDGQRGDPAVETGFDGADVVLSGIDSLGRHIHQDELTQNGGTFDFENLWPGTYTVTVVPPQKFQGSDEYGIPGTVDGTPTGNAGVNKVTTISIGEGENGIDYMLPLSPPQD